MTDPIVDEVRQARDAYAAGFNYDLDAIFRDIKEQEKKSGLQFVAGVAQQTKPAQPHSPGHGIPAAPCHGSFGLAPASKR